MTAGAVQPAVRSRVLRLVFPPKRRRASVETKPTVQTCRWAEPTLYQDGPYWLDAWNMPWTCRRDGDPRTLEDTDVCTNCPRWQAREAHGAKWEFDKEPAKS